MLKQVLSASLIFCLSNTAFAYIVDGSRVNQPRLLSYARDALQNHGTLQQNQEGFAFVQISDEYAQDLLRKMARPGFGIATGAQITVMTPSETKGIKQLRELGQKINFVPLGFYTIVIHDKEYIMLAVDAPELSEIRRSYGLPEKLENHAFNLTVGVRNITFENELASAEDYASLKQP